MKVLCTFIISSLLFVVELALAIPAKDLAPIQVNMERVGGMSHFEFTGQKEWVYDLKKVGNTLELRMSPLEPTSQDKLAEFSSVLVDKIQIDESQSNKSIIRIRLSDKRIQAFDYLTQNPNKLIIDLYVDDDQILSEIRKTKAKESMVAKAPSKKKGSKKKSKNPNRKPAFAEFFEVAQPISGQFKKDGKPLQLKPVGNFSELFDFGELSQNAYNEDDLEAKVIEAEGNIYLRFPPLKLENRHLKELQSFQPDYEIRKSFSDENKAARDLLRLFNQKSFASFIKAKKIYKQNFPQSAYDEILYYVEADTWVELYKLNNKSEYLTKAMDIYRMLIERFPNSKIAERTLIHAGLLAHDVGEYFIATKMLRRYLKKYPYSPFNNHIKIYLGDSLAHLNNFDGAKKTLDEIVGDNERGTAAEAAYRIGDIYFLKQSFRRAERAYSEATAQFPRYAKKFPNAVFNKAEAQFNIAEYPSSLKTFTQFFEKFPNHPYSAFALTRIGELITLLEKDQRKAQGFYNESFFRFRNSIGGTIARMRSLSQRFKDMKSEELQNSIQEIRRREKAIDLHQVDEFASFMISDGYYQRGNFLEAANTLINYFQINPKPINIRKFEKRISRAIAGEVKLRLRKGKVVEALDIIEKHQKSWLSKSRRVDVQLFRAMAYEKMKLLDEALDSYQRIEKRMTGLLGTKEEKERKVFEYYPSFDQVYLRQAVAQYTKGQTKKALSLLNKIKEIKKLDMQSKIDFHYTLSRIAFDNKKYEEALSAATLVESDQIEDKEKREKFNVFLSEVFEKNKRFDKAISILEDFYERFKGEQDQVYVLSRLFQLYRSKGMTDKAKTTGQNLIEEYGSSNNLDKERYYLGEIFFNENNLREAKRVWKDLTKKSMWQELARNKQVSDDWKLKTENQINRIPAMAK